MSEGLGNAAIGSEQTDVSTNSSTDGDTDMAGNKPKTPNEMLAEIARLERAALELREENAKLKVQRERGISCKVSEKGAVSVYGIQRFPVTLYRDQWLRLFGMREDVEAFISEHESELASKIPQPGRPPKTESGQRFQDIPNPQVTPNEHRRS